MAGHRFRIVNVFTADRRALSGNPLCVVENAAALDSDAMQALARQFNLSETTFIQPSTVADAKVRIFTPSYELPFAGHPTLGTAHVCRSLNMGGHAVRLEMQAGVIAVASAADRWTLTAPTPTWRELEESPATLAHALGLVESDIGVRPLWVSAGHEQLIVPLNSEAAVRRAAPLPDLSGIRSAQGLSMAYVFAPTRPERTLARFFFRQGASLLEDPATGSATANFGGWCLAMQRALPLHCEISQGEQIARPSTLYLDVDETRQIRVSGDVIEIATGVVTLD
jgi:PhzF family phenazine biosynthesis protein